MSRTPLMEDQNTAWVPYDSGPWVVETGCHGFHCTTDANFATWKAAAPPANRFRRARSCPPKIIHFAGGKCGSKRKVEHDETRPILVETDRGQRVLCLPVLQRQESGQI